MAHAQGVLKKGAASTTAVAPSNGIVCFYAKPKPTLCTISCSGANLKCVALPPSYPSRRPQHAWP